MLALFEATESHPMVPQHNGVAFSVDADTFMAFARSLPCGINNPHGDPLVPTDLVDFDLCWAFDLADPWGNHYELNCYDYDRIKAELVDADDLNVDRKMATRALPRIPQRPTVVEPPSARRRAPMDASTL